MGREPGNLSARRANVRMYIVSGESLLRVDLAGTTDSPVTLPDKVLSVGNIEEPKAVSDERKVIYEPRVVVRLPEELVVLNLKGETLRSVRLPREARDASVKLFGTTGPDSILVADRLPRGTRPRSSGIRPDGDVATGTTTSAGHPGRDDWSIWLSTGALPSPPLEALMYFVLLPMQYIEQGEAARFPRGAGTKRVTDFGTIFDSLPVVRALLAIYCYRRHRRYSPTGAWSWAAFVLVGGPPGTGRLLVASRLAGGRAVWRMRRDCAGAIVKAALFADGIPPPPLKCIEVFA